MITSCVLLVYLQESARSGNVDPATAAALAAAAQMGGATGSAALEALSSALSGAAGAAGLPGVEAKMSHDYEFSSVELIKPTRMNKVYLVFACSILEQDLMFVVYNIPTVGICRAEQRAKACQKLGISYAELGGLDLFNDNPTGVPQPPRPMGMSNGAAAAQQQQRKRGSGPGWADPSSLAPDGLGHANHRPFNDGLMGLSGSEVNLAALAAGDMAAMGMGMGMQVDNIMGSLGAADGLGMLAGLPGVGASQQVLGAGSAAAAAGAGGEAPARSRQALRELLVEEYEATGLLRKLSPLDIQVGHGLGFRTSTCACLVSAAAQYVTPQILWSGKHL